MISAQSYQVKFKTDGPMLRAINAKSYSPIICRIRAAHPNDFNAEGMIPRVFPGIHSHKVQMHVYETHAYYSF